MPPRRHMVLIAIVGDRRGQRDVSVDGFEKALGASASAAPAESTDSVTRNAAPAKAE